MQTLLMATVGWMFFGYLLSRVLKRNDIADGMWGLGFVALAVCAAWDSGSVGAPWNQWTLRAQLVLVLVCVWGLRLAAYLWIRLLGKSEDARYAAWRKQWGKTEPWRAFLQVFFLQGVILLFVSAPVVWVLREPMAGGELGALGFVGALIVLVGWGIETFADAQMAAFKRARKKGGEKTDVMDRGLWAHSRHPNYLGEILVWWGFYLIAVELSGGWRTLVSPLLMTFLLTRVSGVTMLEPLMSKKSSRYGDYIRRVPALIPGQLRDVWIALRVLGALLVLDGVWLGVIMGPRYTRELHAIARTTVDGGWDPIYWAAALVYVFLAVAVRVFAIGGATDRLGAGLRGALLGMTLYGVYDCTNLALVQHWPVEIALLDVFWGTYLCGTAAWVGFVATRQNP